MVADQRLDVRRTQTLGTHLHTHARIQRRQGHACGFSLGHSDAGIGVQHLTLQIGFFHFVIVDQGKSADSGCSKVQRRGRSQAAGADQRDARVAEPYLPRCTDFRQQQVARIALRGIGVELIEMQRQVIRPPALETTTDRSDMRIAELMQGIRGEQRTRATAAEREDRRALVWHDGGDARLQRCAGDADRSGRSTCCALIVLAHIDQYGAQRLPYTRLVRCDLFDARGKLGKQLFAV